MEELTDQIGTTVSDAGTGEKTAVAASTGAESKPESGDAGETFYRSFKTKDDLIRAYGSLEREFTRKAQELAQLKRGGEPDGEREAELFLERFPEAAEYADEIAEELLRAGDCSGGAAERAYLSVLKRKTEDRGAFLKRAEGDREVREKILRNYLENLPTELPVLANGGRAPSIAPKKAKTLSEAGAEALQRLKK